MFNRILLELAAHGGGTDQSVIDATHLKAHRTSSVAQKRGSTPLYRRHRRRSHQQAAGGPRPQETHAAASECRSGQRPQGRRRRSRAVTARPLPARRPSSTSAALVRRWTSMASSRASLPTPATTSSSRCIGKPCEGPAPASVAGLNAHDAAVGAILTLLPYLCRISRSRRDAGFQGALRLVALLGNPAVPITRVGRRDCCQWMQFDAGRCWKTRFAPMVIYAQRSPSLPDKRRTAARSPVPLLAFREGAAAQITRL